ncbi:immunoglobulin superfamily member 1-like [Triplophysa dalaica]|uniref:immunoglobulin superfamily member 1-like n=1 Tax=Triplophysa dalaica TaxID=1582913 RepID=UPI0024E00DCC|nr:immunoglobulin superfamily member 1-like [Triplophysa dalaica]
MEFRSLLLVLLMILQIHSEQAAERLKARVSVWPDGRLFREETVTLTCDINGGGVNWLYSWYKDSNYNTVSYQEKYTISSVSESHAGLYTCGGKEIRGSRSSDTSDAVTLTVSDIPKPTFNVQPQSVFTGDSVTLTCEVHQSTGWEFLFYTPSQHGNYEASGTKTIRVSDGVQYWCIARRRNYYTYNSDPITVTVEKRPKPQVSVWPDGHLFRGETVTLTCDISGGGVTNWQYSWNKTRHSQLTQYDNSNLQYYTISSVSESDAGQYTCRGTEIRGSRSSDTSDAVTLTVSGVSSSVSLIIRPNRTQHFSSESLSLSCEDHRNSTGWTVRRYTNTLETCSSSSVRSTGTESTCTIRSLITSDTGVYWCESESGHKLHPVNISIHNGDVILDSPVHPVTEGDSLTLHCLYQDKIPSNLRAEFYKDGSVVQNQTTGDMMIISTVSKSHEGFYYCKHPERGESPKSWISVTGFQEEMSGLKILSFLLAVCPYLIVTVVLVFKCHRLRDETSDSSDHMKK